MNKDGVGGPLPAMVTTREHTGSDAWGGSREWVPTIMMMTTVLYTTLPRDGHEALRTRAPYETLALSLAFLEWQFGMPEN